MRINDATFLVFIVISHCNERHFSASEFSNGTEFSVVKPASAIKVKDFSSSLQFTYKDSIKMMMLIIKS